jgi:hypothetical protein
MTTTFNGGSINTGGNLTLGSSTAVIGYSSVRGNPALTGTSGQRIWWTINDYSIGAGSGGAGASIQFAQNNMNYWELISSVNEAGDYNYNVDCIGYYYDGTVIRKR